MIVFHVILQRQIYKIISKHQIKETDFYSKIYFFHRFIF